jgi:hypothetical protein
LKIKVVDISVAIILFAAPLYSQFHENNFGISINAVYTTSADIFLNPNSSDIVVRNKPFVVVDILNPSLDIRYKFNEWFILGLNIEYMQKSAVGPNLTVFLGNRIVVFEVEDGFRVIPIELTAHYLFPFSTDRFIFMMGGGMGYYRGKFTRKFSDVDLSIQQRQVAIGIHVSASMDYMPLEFFSIRFEMKFRDPQYNVTSKYNKTIVIYQGEEIQLHDDAFETKVNVNGVTFILGAVFHF